ncbi:MAG: FHA domain-containing protein [Chloroflexi bacterium]|uniref:FHA domain-containing protein n=1 Tax=Candidatus Chlorohelix allophototropha TaxID=3003348 RepID=A0A8T7M721_9CHLR|nr:FHA domain-containing protein [Chloroflexota bacterium]WJW69855.1 FHA domain-containing protein [Chloroflexota bacterium L227-S17]
MATSFLIVQRGEEIGQRINLDEARITFGRNNDNVIILNDPLVSRYHAMISTSVNGQLTIADLGSTNGVMVNDKLIEAGIPVTLKHRDLIVIGKSIFCLQLRPEGYRASPPPSREDAQATLYLPAVALFS